MLLLGHVGCALAATQIGEAAYRKVAGRRLDAAAKLFDYRFLVLGSVLPDIIDKPLAFLVLPEVLQTSRNIAHTLWLPLMLLIVWRLFSGRSLNLLLPLAIGSGLHLVLDGMFTVPRTLLWPATGWEFLDDGPTDLFSGLPIPWALPWNIQWQIFSEFLGGLFIGLAMFISWRKPSQGVRSHVSHSPVLLKTPAPPPR